MLKFKEGSKAQIKVNVAAEPFQLAKDYTLTFYLGSIEKAIRDVTQNCGVLIFNFTADELSAFHAGEEGFAKIEVSDDSNGVFQLEFWPFKVTDAEEILLQSEQEISVVVNVAKKVEGGGHHGGDIEIPKTTELLRGDGNGGIVAAPLDDIVTEDSDNGVKSSGIWEAIKNTVESALSVKRDKTDLVVYETSHVKSEWNDSNGFKYAYLEYNEGSRTYIWQTTRGDRIWYIPADGRIIVWPATGGRINMQGTPDLDPESADPTKNDLGGPYTDGNVTFTFTVRGPDGVPVQTDDMLAKVSQIELADTVTEDGVKGVKSSGIWDFVMPKETFVKNEATGLWHRVIAESNEYGTITMNVDQAGDSEDHGKDPQAFNPQTKLWHRMYAVANEDGHITVEIAQEGSEQKAIGE